MVFVFAICILSMSATSQRLTLVENPKTRKDWENNKLYYQQKFFSKNQKDVLKEKERKQEIALKHISIRQPHVSGVDGGMSCPKKVRESNWKYRAESISIFQKQMNDGSTDADNSEENKPVDCNDTKTENKTQYIIQITSTNVDDWEELC